MDSVHLSLQAGFARTCFTSQTSREREGHKTVSFLLYGLSVECLASNLKSIYALEVTVHKWPQFLINRYMGYLTTHPNCAIKMSLIIWGPMNR